MQSRSAHERAERFDREDDARDRLAAQLLVFLVLEAVGQPPRRIGFEDLAGIGGLAVQHQREGRADLPVGRDLGAEPVVLGEVARSVSACQSFSGVVSM